MKKLIAYIIIVFSLLIIAIFGFLFYLKLKPPKLYDTSQLQTLNINGQNIKTTGAIPNQDPSTIIAEEITSLAAQSPIIQDGFQVNVQNNGEVVIKLSSPVTQNKQKALDWLKNNGFGKIPTSSINFIDSSGNSLTF